MKGNLNKKSKLPVVVLMLAMLLPFTVPAQSGMAPERATANPVPAKVAATNIVPAKAAAVNMLLVKQAVAEKKNDLPPGLDAHIAKVLEAFDVPGVGVAIVKDGEILLSRGYGVKRLGDPAPVDENTLFSIASNSKAFTATSLALLVEQGKLNWEDRVIKHLPWFALSDDYVTQNLTVRDLLVHHSGLPAYANDMLNFPPAQMTRKELLLKLKDVPLVHDFRSVYAYDNILYLAAGEVVEAVSGMEWEDFVKKRIFGPLGMKNSISRFSTMRDQPNIAWAHARRGGAVKVMDTFFDLNIGDPGNPAGGVVTSAADMARWIKMHLDSGRIDDNRRLFKPGTTRELWQTVIPMPISQEPEWLKPAQKHFYGYALGFRTYDYRGYQIVGHGGLLTGFVSQIALVPQLDLGVVVLTNQLSSGAYWSIIHEILDYYMGAESFDWLAGYKKEWDRSNTRQDSIAKAYQAVQPDPNMPRSLPISAYAGAYNDSFIGRMVITERDSNALHLSFAKARFYNGVLQHFHGDLFRLVYDDPNRGDGPFLSFTLNADKSIREARFVSEKSGGSNSFGGIVLTPDKQAILDGMALHKKIEQEFAKQPKGNFAYAFIDLQTGERLSHQGDRSYHSASTMKTPVMVEAYRQAASGKFSLDNELEVYNRFVSIADRKVVYSLDPADDAEQGLYDLIGQKTTWRDLIYRMITESSNLATNILIDKLGAKNIMAMLRSVGADGVQVLRGVEDIPAYEKGMNNAVTADGLASFFEALASGKFGDKYTTGEMVEILSDQRHRDIIPGRLPAGVTVAHKTGWITGINHDSGIVYLPDGRKYVLVLLSQDLEAKEAKDVLSRVSRHVYDYVK